MKTILTDDDIAAIPVQDCAENYARAVIAAYEAKLAQQAPVAWMLEGWGPDCGPYVEFYRDDEMGVLRERKDFIALYTHPAPQQADRQRVPERWRGVVKVVREAMHEAAAYVESDAMSPSMARECRAAVSQLDAMLAAAPEAPVQAEKRCEWCDDTGDVIAQIGEWRGRCICPAGKSPKASDVDERAAITEEDAYEMGAKGAEPTEHERKLFEAWMRGHCWALSAYWDGRQYVSDEEEAGGFSAGAMATRGLWAAWRDRAALAQKDGAA